MKFALGLLLPALSLITIDQAQAQNTASAGALPRDPQQAAIATYHAAMGEEAHLFSGSEFISFPISPGVHQFYKYNQLQEATLVYEEKVYRQVPVLYDIVNDDVIVGRYKEQGATNHLRVDKSKITEFNLAGQTFIHLRDNNKGIAAGFYEQLYKGNLQVLAKRKKSYKKEVVTVTFPEDNYYYILKDGNYYAVKSKGSVLKVLKDHKKELSQFLKANNIIFSESRELAIAKLVEQYDLLTQAK